MRSDTDAAFSDTMTMNHDLGSLNRDVWSQNFKRHVDFSVSFVQQYFGKVQNHSQNKEKSRHAKKNSTLRLMFSISNVVFKLATVR